MKCSKCGKEINEQAKFCKYCGAPVQVEKQVSSANASKVVQRRNSKTWIIIASILLGILVLTGVTVLTVKMTGEKDKATQKIPLNQRSQQKNQRQKHQSKPLRIT